MECELEQGQKICPYCYVRHIGRCQEDVDRWRIREIVATGVLTRAGKALTHVWSGRNGNRFWDVLFDSLLLSAETCHQHTDCHSGTKIGRLRCFDDGKVARLSLLLVRAVGS